MRRGCVRGCGCWRPRWICWRERGEDGVSICASSRAPPARTSRRLAGLRLAEITLCRGGRAGARTLLGSSSRRRSAGSGRSPRLRGLGGRLRWPMIRAIALGGRELAVMQIVARAGVGSTGGVGSVRSALRAHPCGCPAGAEGDRPWRQGPGAHLPHALRGWADELARAGAGRNRAPEQVPEAARAAAGPGSRWNLPWHERGLTRAAPHPACPARVAARPRGHVAGSGEQRLAAGGRRCGSCPREIPLTSPGRDGGPSRDRREPRGERALVEQQHFGEIVASAYGSSREPGTDPGAPTATAAASVSSATVRFNSSPTM